MTIRINELMEALGSANDAVQTLPKVQAELRSLAAEYERAKAQIERLRASNETAVEELAKAKDAARSIGAERDEAQFRTLELEEKLTNLTNVLGPALGLVAPPKDEPKPEPVPEPVDEVKQEREQDRKPIVDNTGDFIGRRSHIDEDQRSQSNSPQPVSPSAPEVAAEASHPSPSAPANGATSENNSEPQSSPQTAGIATPSAEPEAGRYQGWSWRQKPNHVTWTAFLASGGERPYWLTPGTNTDFN